MLCVLLHDDPREEKALRAAAALGASALRVTIRSPDDPDGFPPDQETPALIILMCADVVGAASSLRARGGAAATAPLIAVADHVREVVGVDAIVGRTAGLAALVAEADRWRPDAGAATLDRLSTVFGAEQTDALAEGLRAMLVKGLAADAGPKLADLAHRIAGLAGSLGFAAVSRSWLAVAGGESAAMARARQDARCAVTAIDRRQSIGKPKT